MVVVKNEEEEEEEKTEKRKRKEEWSGKGKKKKIWYTDEQGSTQNETLSGKLSYNHGINLSQVVTLFAFPDTNIKHILGRNKLLFLNIFASSLCEGL